MNNINPKWQNLLNAIPAELHPVVTPHLAEWDKGVQEQFQARTEEIKKYEAYKDFVEQNIDPQYVLQAVQVADLIRENPADVANRLNKTYNLGLMTEEEAKALTPDPDGLEDLEGLGNVDIENHPKFKEVMSTLQQLQQGFESRTQQEQQEAEMAEFESYLDELEEKYKDQPFDRTIVTAYLANTDMDGDQAVKAFQETLTKYISPEQLQQQQLLQQQPGQQQANNGTAPPVVLDGSPTGSGLPNEQVDFGGMKKNSVNDYVEQLLQQSANSGQ